MALIRNGSIDYSSFVREIEAVLFRGETVIVMGGGRASLLAVMGSVALSVGAVAAGVVLRRSGHSWGPIAVLVICSFGIAVFRTHAWPGGPLTFGGIAVAGAWVLWERSRAPWPPVGAA